MVGEKERPFSLFKMMNLPRYLIIRQLLIEWTSDWNA